MNDTYLTLIGNVVDEPRMRVVRTGQSVTNFRMASTPRRFDRESNTWVDGTTLFVNVSCWRSLAEHVAASVHKGDPVVVTGRYFAREYEVDEARRTSYELDATAVGHDLSRGITLFSRTRRVVASAPPASDAGVAPDVADQPVAA